MLKAAFTQFHVVWSIPNLGANLKAMSVKKRAYYIVGSKLYYLHIIFITPMGRINWT